MNNNIEEQRQKNALTLEQLEKKQEEEKQEKEMKSKWELLCEQIKKDDTKNKERIITELENMRITMSSIVRKAEEASSIEEEKKEPLKPLKTVDELCDELARLVSRYNAWKKEIIPKCLNDSGTLSGDDFDDLGFGDLWVLPTKTKETKYYCFSVEELMSIERNPYTNSNFSESDKSLISYLGTINNFVKNFYNDSDNDSDNDEEKKISIKEKDKKISLKLNELYTEFSFDYSLLALLQNNELYQTNFMDELIRNNLISLTYESEEGYEYSIETVINILYNLIVNRSNSSLGITVATIALEVKDSNIYSRDTYPKDTDIKLITEEQKNMHIIDKSTLITQKINELTNNQHDFKLSLVNELIDIKKWFDIYNKFLEEKIISRVEIRNLPLGLLQHHGSLLLRDDQSSFVIFIEYVLSDIINFLFIAIIIRENVKLARMVMDILSSDLLLERRGESSDEESSDEESSDEERAM